MELATPQWDTQAQINPKGKAKQKKKNSSWGGISNRCVADTSAEIHRLDDGIHVGIHNPQEEGV